MATNRETARDALVSLLTAKLVGDGLPVKTVQGSKLRTLEGNWPAVVVLSAGSERIPLTFQGDQTKFYFRVQSVVQQSSGDTWDNADAEDAIDEIEKLIAEVYEDNDATANWELLRISGRTTVTEVAVAGVPCYLENIPTEVILGRS